MRGKGREASGSVMWPRWKIREYSLLQYLRECVWGLERVESRINMLRHAWSTPCFSSEQEEVEGANPRGAAGPRSCLVPDSEDDDSPPVCLRYARAKRLSCIPSMDGDDGDEDDEDDDDDDDDEEEEEEDHEDDENDNDDAPSYTTLSEDTQEANQSDEKSIEEPATPPPAVTVTPAMSPVGSPRERRVARARQEQPQFLPPRPRTTQYVTRKISLPIPVRIPEGSVANHHSRYCLPMPSYLQRHFGSPLHRQVRRAWERLP